MNGMSELNLGRQEDKQVWGTFECVIVRQLANDMRCMFVRVGDPRGVLADGKGTVGSQA